MSLTYFVKVILVAFLIDNSVQTYPGSQYGNYAGHHDNYGGHHGNHGEHHGNHGEHHGNHGEHHGNYGGHHGNYNPTTWDPTCSATTTKRLGMCYRKFEKPQVDLDAESNLPVGHNFFIYGKSKNGGYLGSHISTLFGSDILKDIVHPHIYSATVEIRLLDQNCRNFANRILAGITDPKQNLRFQFNETAIKLVDLVTNHDSEVYVVVVPTYTFTLEVVTCKSRFSRLIDLRRYHFSDQPTPQPRSPALAGWLIFSNGYFGSVTNQRDRFYMERLPVRCKDIHQWLEVTPVGPISRTHLKWLLNYGRRGAVIRLANVKGKPELNDDGIPIDPIVLNKSYNAITSESNSFGERLRFQVKIKRKVVTDPDFEQNLPNQPIHFLNIGCLPPPRPQ